MKKYLKETVKYLLRSRYLIAPYINEIEYMYGMSKEELKQRNEQVFLRIFRKAYNKSVFYHKFYTDAGINIDDIKTLDDIKKLPVLTKEMVRKHADEMIVAPKWKLITNHTSGTTGTPLKVYEDWPSIWREQAYFYCYRKRCGFTYGQPLVSLRGNLEKKDLYLKVHISNTLYLSSYNINEKTVGIYYEQIIRHKPIAIEGYPSSLYSLALLLRDKKLQLHIPVAFTSSESLLDYQRALIEKQFDTNIYDHYGTTERTIRLSETINHNGYYEDPGYSINEYTEDGEITTSLINESFPMIRYMGNDVMDIDELDGNEKQVIVKKIEGRKSSVIIGKDGTQYSSALLTRIFKSMTTIDNVQFIQEKVGHVKLNVVVENSFTDADMERLRTLVSEQLGGNNFDIEISKVQAKDLIYTAQGKFNYVVSLTNVNSGGVIKRICGRNEDYLVCKDGSRIKRLGFVMKNSKNIKASQIIQECQGKVLILVVPEENFNRADANMIVSSFKERVGPDNMDVSLKETTMNGLVYSNNGKFKYIINKISN